MCVCVYIYIYIYIYIERERERERDSLIFTNYTNAQTHRFSFTVFHFKTLKSVGNSPMNTMSLLSPYGTKHDSGARDHCLFVQFGYKI